MREPLHEVASQSLGLRFGKILREIERTPHERVIASPNRPDGDRHGGVRFPDAGWPNQEGSVMIANEPRGRQVDEPAARNLRIERPVEGRELLHLGNSGLLEPPDEEPIGASGQLVLDEQVEKVEMLEGSGLRLFETEGQGFGHAGES